MKRFAILAAVFLSLALFTPEISEAGCGSGRMVGRGNWYPGKNIVRVISAPVRLAAARRSSARSRGAWYFGVNLGR